MFLTCLSLATLHVDSAFCKLLLLEDSSHASCDKALKIQGRNMTVSLIQVPSFQAWAAPQSPQKLHSWDQSTAHHRHHSHGDAQLTTVADATPRSWTMAMLRSSSCPPAQGTCQRVQITYEYPTHKRLELIARRFASHLILLLISFALQQLCYLLLPRINMWKTKDATSRSLWGPGFLARSQARSTGHRATEPVAAGSAQWFAQGWRALPEDKALPLPKSNHTQIGLMHLQLLVVSKSPGL